MSSMIEVRNRGLHWTLAALLVLALTFVPVLVPIFSALRAAEPEPNGGAPVTHNDRDGDGIVDTIDIDDDNDGVPDIREINPHGRDRDTDGDGMPDRIDLDSDNDGIVDWREAGIEPVVNMGQLRTLGGRLVGEVGSNGLIDLFETAVDSGVPNYTLADSDEGADAFPDIIDLDSDNDGILDLTEAGVAAALDGDRDGRIDAPPGSVGNDGIADHVQFINDLTCCDVTGDGVEDVVPRDTDGQGTPDYRDLDSDDDGINDLVEWGGTDIDNDGRVDGFVDTALLGDGADDALVVVPLVASDTNGNGLEDHLDVFAPDPSGGVASTPGGADPVVASPIIDTADSEPAPAIPAVDEPAEPVPSVSEPAPSESSVQDPALTDPTPTDPAPIDPALNDPLDTGDPDPMDTPDAPAAATPTIDDLDGSGNEPADGGLNEGVKVGLGGTGCSIAHGSTDLVLLLAALFGMAGIGWRYTLRRVRRR